MYFFLVPPAQLLIQTLLQQIYQRFIAFYIVWIAHLTVPADSGKSRPKAELTGAELRHL